MGKIVTKEIEFDELIEGKVKPFSNSAHIPFSKKYVGRIVKVIVPVPEKCFWLLTEGDKKKLIKMAEKVKIRDGMYAQQRRNILENAIKDFQKSTFKTRSLEKIINHLDEKNVLVEKVKKLYGI